MNKIMKVMVTVVLAAMGHSLFAYNGGYENSSLTDIIVGGVTYKGYGNNTVTKRTESGTAIAENAYAQCSKLTSVNLTGVTSIGNAAFAYSALTTVELPATLKTMGFIAFGGCKSLASVTINSTAFMTSADEAKEPFRDCTALKTVTAKCAPPSWDFKKVFPNVTTVKVPQANLSAWQAKKYSGVTIALSELTYTVCYHKYDGSGTTRDQAVPVGAETRLLYMDSQLGWSRPGYEFVGWAPDPNSRLCKYLNGDKVKDLAAANATVDLYATWLSPSSYRVCFHRNFDASDATKLNQIVLRNTETVLAGMNNLIGWSTRNGYTFMGWAETAGGTVKYANCEKVVNLSSIAGGTKHLYAVWKFNGYTVRYHKYDGSGTIRDQVISAGAETRLLYMDSQLGWSRSGYEFVGWAPDPNSRLCKYLNGDKVKDLAAAGATVDLYATWLSPSSYRVCFHRNFDSKDETKLNQIVLRNTETVLAGMNNLIKWTRTGYTFMGWAETAGGAVKYANCAKVLNISSIAGGTKHLYAVWKASQTVMPPVKPQTSSVKPQTSNVKPQTSNLISGVFADGSGWFDLLVEEDGTAFFRAETEDGVREAECEAEEVDGALLLTFEDAASLVIRLVSGAWVAE